MTDDEIKNLRRACESAPPRVDGRQVILDPRTLTALLDEVKRMRPVYEAAKTWMLAFGPSQHDRATFAERRLAEAVDAALSDEAEVEIR